MASMNERQEKRKIYLPLEWRDSRGNGLLHLSANKGNASMLRMLLKQNLKIDSRNNRGDTALVCANYAKPSIISMLLNAGADVNATNYLGQSPLHLAVKSGNLDSVNFVLDRGVNTELVDIESKSALFLAVERQMFDVVLALLNRGVKINNPQCCYGILTPSGQITSKELFMLLLKHGADVNKQDNDGFSALHNAVYKGNVEYVKQLLNHGADIGTKTFEGDTPLHWANFVLTENSHEIIRILLARGADCNDKNTDHITPFHLALKIFDIEIIQMFLEYGADMDAISLKKECPIHFVATNPNADVIELVLNSGCEIDKRSVNGYTALHYAVLSKNFTGCEILLKHGADVNVKCIKGRTPIYLAARVKQFETFKLLLDHGARIMDKTKTGKSLLNAAVNCKNKNILSTLLRELAKHDYVDRNVDSGDLKIIYEDEKMKEFYDICFNELINMSKIKIYNDVTLYKILMESDKIISGYARNEELISALEAENWENAFRVYYTVLKERFYRHVEKQRLTRETAKILNKVFQFNESNHIVNMTILKYFTKEEMIEFIMLATS